MNDSKLNELLKSVPTPGRAPEFWEQFPRRLTARLHWQESGQHTKNFPVRRRRLLAPLEWGLAAGLACLVIGFMLGNWRGGNQAKGFLQNEQVVREVLAMFPNQVRAIIQDENGLSLSLADQPDMPVSTPLWIKICDGQHCRSIVTFSGQSVQIAGQRVEVLADARGGVMLVGDRFFWSSQETARNEPLRIDAQPLNHVL